MQGLDLARGVALTLSAAPCFLGEETLLGFTCSLQTSAVFISHVLDTSLAGCCCVPGLATLCAQAAHTQIFKVL